MQHGLGEWLALELNESYDERNRLRDQVEGLHVQIAELSIDLHTATTRNQEIGAQLDEMNGIYNDLVMRVVRNRIANRAKLEELTETNERLTRLLDIQTNEAKGLAKALRRSRVELEEATNNGWLSKKKAKHE